MASIDSEYLLELARDKSREHRDTLAQTVSDLFLEGGTALTERERALMFDILHSLVREAELSVRRSLSDKLAALPDSPLDLVRMLANDEIEVAYPILVSSTVLQDVDLIEVIRARTQEHQIAVAVRKDLNTKVSDALVETGDHRVIRKLLENQDARLSSATMAYLVEQSERVDSFQEPILQRQDLDPLLAKRMFMWVSAVLRQHILDKFELDPETVDDLLEEAVLEEVAIDTEPKISTSKCGKLAATMVETGVATPELLIQTLRDGEVPLFRALLANLTQIKPKLVSRILTEPGGEGLAIACKSIGMDKPSFAGIFSISRSIHLKSTTTNRNDIRKALNLYDRMTRDAAAKVVRYWRRDENYLSAIRELELSS